MEVRADRGIEAIRYTRKARLLAGASCAALALACGLPAPASAANYNVANDTQLRNAITAANASPDASSTITLTASFTTINPLPMPTKSITIDTQGFVLAGRPTGTGSIVFQGVLPSVAMTFNGTFVGGNSTGAANAGHALTINTFAGSAGQVINNGSVRGGDAIAAGRASGAGINLINDATLVNNGTISGGTANAYVRPIGGALGADSPLATVRH